MPTVFVVTFIFKLVSKESVYCVEEQTSSYRRSVWYLFFRGCRYHFLLLDVGDITINMCSASLFCVLNYSSIICEFTEKKKSVFLFVVKKKNDVQFPEFWYAIEYFFMDLLRILFYIILFYVHI